MISGRRTSPRQRVADAYLTAPGTTATVWLSDPVHGQSRHSPPGPDQIRPNLERSCSSRTQSSRSSSRWACCRRPGPSSPATSASCRPSPDNSAYLSGCTRSWRPANRGRRGPGHRPVVRPARHRRGCRRRALLPRRHRRPPTQRRPQRHRHPGVDPRSRRGGSRPAGSFPVTRHAELGRSPSATSGSSKATCAASSRLATLVPDGFQPGPQKTSAHAADRASRFVTSVQQWTPACADASASDLANPGSVWCMRWSRTRLMWNSSVIRESASRSVSRAG
jgi:hypothetical protein